MAAPTVSQAAVLAARKRKGLLAGLRSAEARHQLWGYVFLAPMFLLLATFKFIPMF